MRITFLGAAQTVTGSRHLIETDSARVLLDCGLFQGRRKEADRLNRDLGVDPGSVDTVVLSHCHIDHVGNLPTLARGGFKGKVITTAPTRDLASIMLRDSAHIQEKDAEFVNKRRRRRGKDKVEPLYTEEDVQRVIPRFRAAPLHKPVEVADGMTVTFRDAGHILGSATIQLDVEDGPARRRLVFSGDLGQPGRPIIRDPEPVPGADVLLMESTYGNRVHEAVGDVGAALADIVRRVIQRGGKVIIPAFSVGRSQHVVYYLGQAIREGLLPEIPIFVDSPLTTNVTEVYREHPEWYDAETREALEDSGDPLGFYRLTYIKDVQESKALNTRRTPCVIISASGMCEAGRILHHLRNNIGDPRNAVVIVGFQAQHTLGRRLVERRSVVKIFGEPFERRAEVYSLPGLSAHADRDGLLDWVGAMSQSPGRIYLVHGEVEAQESLMAALRERGHDSVHNPARGESVTI